MFFWVLLIELAQRKGSGRANTILRVRREGEAGGCTHSIWQQEALDQPAEHFETIHLSSNQSVINICDTFRQRDKSLSGIQEAAWWQELRLLETCLQLGDIESRRLPLRPPAFMVVFQWGPVFITCLTLNTEAKQGHLWSSLAKRGSWGSGSFGLGLPRSRGCLQQTMVEGEERDWKS